jgi:hypothetical protein
MNPYHTYNGGGPVVPPVRTFGNYSGGSAPRQVPALSGGDSAGEPASLHMEDIPGLIDSLHGPEQHPPHIPHGGQRGGAEPEDEAGGAAEAGAEGAADLGAGAGAEALETVGIVGGLL